MYRIHVCSKRWESPREALYQGFLPGRKREAFEQRGHQVSHCRMKLMIFLETQVDQRLSEMMAVLGMQ